MGDNVIKCVVVGDGFVGKTSLLMRLCQKECESEYNPTVFDNHSVSTVYNGKTYEILLVDTAGQEEYGMLRKQVYESTNVFLVCFSVSSTDSFLNVKQVWLPEIEGCSGASKILVGTKSDLRNDTETIDRLNASGSIFVTETIATNLAQSHNMKYIECSSTTQDNVPEVLKTVIEVYFSSKQGKSSKQTSANSCRYCINPIVRFLRRALCCKNNY